MNDSIRWDSSIVKKYSSSNHFKLLNQLRTEVKKYPLNNKKTSTSFQDKDINKDNKLKGLNSQNGDFSKNTNKNFDYNTNKSNVSFNNSKNFSIYNQTSNNSIIRQDEIQINSQSNSNEDSSTPSFKDRLDKIDMR